MGMTSPKDYVKAPTANPMAQNLGNYLVFSGLDAPNIIVESSTATGLGFGNNPRAPINAIQLVPAGSGVVVVPPGKMTITRTGATVTITWEGDGTLQSATNPKGPWTDIGPTKPWTDPATAPMMFYRVKGQ
jgi:hypothetical protein